MRTQKGANKQVEEEEKRKTKKKKVKTGEKIIEENKED